MLVLNNKKTKLILVSIFLVSCFAVFFYFLAGPVLAQSGMEGYGEEYVERLNVPRVELIRSIINVINYVLGLLALITVVLILYAGFMWMTAGGNGDKVTKAKTILTNALIGLVIIMLSFAITMFVFRVLTNKLAGSNPYGQPCSPSTSCVSCNIYCNADSKTEYNPSACGTAALCGSSPILPTNSFKISSIVTTCGDYPNYTKDVYLCSAVVVNFNHHLNKESADDAVQTETLKIEKCADKNCSNTTLYSGNDSDTEWKISNRSISFTHENLFAKNQTYRLVIPKTLKNINGELIDQSDACGSGLNVVTGCVESTQNYYWVFETGETTDITPPTLVDSFPTSDSTDNKYPERNVNLKPIMWAKFSEAIAPWTVTKNNIRLRPVTGSVSSDGTGGNVGAFINPDDYEVEINSHGDGFEIYDIFLDPFVWYQIEVSDIYDLCNLPIENKLVWRFQTNDVGPGVSQVYPADGSYRACSDTAVFISFNTSMYNPETSSCLVTVNGNNGGYVTSGTLTPGVNRDLQVVDNYINTSLDPNNFCKVYEFLPDTAILKVSENYTAEIKTDLIINKDNDVLEKSWGFKTASAEVCVNSPVITRLSPSRGPDGTCLTIFGHYFNDTAGQLKFNDENIAYGAWSDEQITTTIPNPTNLDKSEAGKKYPFQVNTSFQGENLASNKYNFLLEPGEAANGPCLFGLSPDQGCFNDEVEISGIRFGAQNNSSAVIFSANQNATINEWTVEKIKTSVPNSTIDGEVVVKNSVGTSNPLNFDVSCGNGVVCGTDVNMCLNGNSICSSGYGCVPKGNQCECKKSVTDADKYLKIIQNSQCQLEAEPDPILPSPNPRPDSEWNCLNGLISIKFNERLNQSTVNTNNFIVEKCSNLTANGCQSWQEVVGTLQSFEYPNEYGGLIFEPNNDLNADTRYRVTVTTNILSLFDHSLADNYTWEFTTAPLGLGQSGTCPVAKVILQPSSATLNYVGDNQEFKSLPTSSQANGCAFLTGSYDWDWLSENTAVATVSDNVKNDVNTAVAVDAGATKINATAENKTGSARVQVKFGACSQSSDCDACAGSVCNLDKKLCTPSVTSISPNKGLDNSWVTLNGCYFGYSRGSGYVRFGTEKLETSAYYPCPNSWTDDQIIFKAPDVAEENATRRVEVITDNNLISKNQKSYEITPTCGIYDDARDTPGLCFVSPVYAQTDALIKLGGQNFSRENADADKGKILFNNGSLENKDWQTKNWSDKLIKDVGISEDINSGLVRVEVNECPSNSVNFYKIGSACDGDTDTPLCQVEQNMCGRGLLCEQSSCTCQLPPQPVVNDVEILDFSPTGNDVMCTNQAVQILFNQIMDKDSVNQNLKVWYSSDTKVNDNCRVVNQNVSLNKKGLLAKLFSWIKGAWAANENTFDYWCPQEFSTRWSTVSNGTGKCNVGTGAIKDDCGLLNIYGRDEFTPNTTYLVEIASGVKASNGGTLTVDQERKFGLSASAEICLLNKVEIDPSYYNFTRRDQTQDFVTHAKDKNSNEIFGVPDYNWSWQWSKDDEEGLITVTGSTSDTETVGVVNENGQATLKATASVISKDYKEIEKTGSARITIDLCENPWPADGQPYENDSNEANFYLSYCRDQGADGVADDLPALNETPSVANRITNKTTTATTNGGVDTGTVLKEYLFLREDGSTDAIGLRIFSNPEHLSPAVWYASRSFENSGSLQSVEVDGYQAVRDGRSVYVAATSLSGSTLYTNIYLISYNENASAETVAIFNDLVDKWYFNKNVINYLDKQKIVRDTKRITDLGAIKSYLEAYKDSSSENTTEQHYPILEAGSFNVGQSTSKWPSWSATLSTALKNSLPVDPINEFYKKCQSGTADGDECENDADCPQGQCLVVGCLPPFDEDSCWNQDEKSFNCSDGSHIYQYLSTDSGGSFSLYANLEYDVPGINWNKLGNFSWKKTDVCNDLIITQP